jgi:hypothetical protein
MTPPTYVLVAGAIAALLALLLSITPYVIVARRLGLAALWLSLAVVPLAVVLDLGELSAVSGATVFSHVLEHTRSYAGIALPCAFIASLALRRAKAARRR